MLFRSGGRYVNTQWVLEEIEQSVLEEGRVVRKTAELAAWESLLSPEVVTLVTVRPEHLSLRGIVEYTRYLRQNNQNSQRYEQALWSKIINPFAVIAMVVLAVPLVRSHSRTVAIGQRVVMGCLIGVAFHIVNQISGQMGLVYSVPAVLAALLPTLLLFGAIGWLLYRER